MKRTIVWLLDPLRRWLESYMARSGLVLYGGKSSAPASPDYTGAANAQSAASQEMATANTWANRPTQNTPWGTTSWDAGVGTDPATGQPVTQWTQNQTLDPALQSALDQQLAIQGGRSDLAGSFMDRVRGDYAQPFDWRGLPQTAATPGAQITQGQQMQTGIPQYGLDASRIGQTTQTTNAPAFSEDRRRIEDASFQRMQPEHDRQRANLENQLVNQGVTRGSQQWNEAQAQMADQQAGERFKAMEFGGGEQQRMNQQLMGQQQQAFGQAGQIQQLQNAALMQQFGQGQQAGQFRNTAAQQMFNQDLAANQQNYGQNMQSAEYQNRLRQQSIAEQAMARGMSLNELNALLTGQQVGTPQMPGFNTATQGQAPQYLNAANMQGQYDLGAAKLGSEADSAMWGGIGKLAGAAGMMYMGSDVRLKSNIVRVGEHPVGVGVYEYDIHGRRERGVIAQELLAVRPDLVYTSPSGYLMVAYGGL